MIVGIGETDGEVNEGMDGYHARKSSNVSVGKGKEEDCNVGRERGQCTQRNNVKTDVVNKSCHGNAVGWVQGGIWEQRSVDSWIRTNGGAIRNDGGRNIGMGPKG